MKTISKAECLDRYGIDIDEVQFSKRDEIQPPNSPTDAPKAPLSDKLEQMVDAMLVAAPTLDRQTATAFLLHTAHGRRLAEHLNNLSKGETPMPQVDITKLRNIASVVEVAKNVIDDKVTLTEHQFTEILTGHAKLAKRTGESTMAAFERILTDPENADLRKAHALTKGYQPAD